MLDQDLSKLKVSELREQLKLRGINSTGVKQDLVDRLQAAISGSHETLDSKLEDELLNDDDHFLEEEKSLLESTQDLLKSPDSSKSTTPDSVVPAKKVSLKRNVSIPLELFDTKIEETEDKKDESEEPEKKVVKISTMSALDRLEMRAKKFGGGSAAVSSSSTTTTDVASQSKLEARAARFGLSATSNQTSAVSSSSPASADILKKRAERFGAITSDAKKSELDEKLQKRKERFGNAGKVTVPSGASADYEEKARLRLERFKQTA